VNNYYWKLRVGAKYNPSQPRVPAGSSEGGQWTATGEPQVPSSLRTKGAKVQFIRDANDNSFTIKASQGAEVMAIWRNAYFNGNKSPTRGELFFVEAGERRRQGIGTSLARDALEVMKRNGTETVIMYKATEEGGYLIQKLLREGDVEFLSEASFGGKAEYRIGKVNR
jgi:hypothetical protein